MGMKYKAQFSKKYKKQFTKKYKKLPIIDRRFREVFTWPKLVQHIYFKIFLPLYANSFSAFLLHTRIIKWSVQFFIIFSFLFFISDTIGCVQYTPFVFLSDFLKHCMLWEIRFFLAVVSFFYFIYHGLDHFTFIFFSYTEKRANCVMYIRWAIHVLWDIRNVWVICTTGIFGLYFKMPFFIIWYKTVPFWVEWPIDWVFTYFFP